MECVEKISTQIAYKTRVINISWKYSNRSRINMCILFVRCFFLPLDVAIHCRNIVLFYLPCRLFLAFKKRAMISIQATEYSDKCCLNKIEHEYKRQTKGNSVIFCMMAGLSNLFQTHMVALIHWTPSVIARQLKTFEIQF